MSMANACCDVRRQLVTMPNTFAQLLDTKTKQPDEVIEYQFMYYISNYCISTEYSS